jgi:HK97 family phage major capsid protein
MTKLVELRQALGKAGDELGYLVDDEAGFEAKMQEIDGLKASIARAEKAQATQASLAVRHGANEENDPPADETKFKSFGDQLIAIYRHAAEIGSPDRRLVRAATGASEADPTAGGFLVQTDFAAGIIARAYETGQILQRLTKITIGAGSNGVKINAVDETSRVTGSRWGGVQCYWQGEGDLLAGTKPKFRQIELDLKKLTGLWYATDELLQDSTALTQVANQAFSEEFAFTIEDSCIRGTGAGMPLGILNAPCSVTVAAETGQATKTIVYENILNMWSRMWAKSRANAVWFINQDVEPQLFALNQVIGTAGVPVYLPPNGIAGQSYGTLFGRPVIAIEYCATLGTAGDIILADFSQYLMADKGGVQAASSMHARFVYDEMVFRFVYRADGQPAWNAALTPYQGTATKSPFILLANR